MTVKIRLTRGGRKKIARYRIVVADSRSPRDGRFLETLGSYNPQAEPKEFTINTRRMGYWLKQGAEVSDTVSNLLKQDSFNEKQEALEKGIPLENLEIARKPERKKRPKRKEKAGKESKESVEGKAS